MADTLHINPKTVGGHIENIYGKTGLSMRASVTLYSAEQGLVGL